MQKLLGYVRTTAIGGVVFVLPLLLATFIISKTIEIFEPVADPVLEYLGVKTIIGVATTTVASLLTLALAAFLFGLLAQTLMGQSMLKKMQGGIMNALPRFNLMQGLIRNLDQDQGKEIPVVLVPTDAGWCLALQLEERHGDWYTVYIPGSPQLTSGTLAFAHADDVHPVNLPLGRVMMLLRTCGSGSTDLCNILAELKASGNLGGRV